MGFSKVGASFTSSPGHSLTRSLPHLVTLSCLLAGTAFAQPKYITLDNDVHAFLQDYCVKGHGPDEDKGDYVLHEFFSR